MNSQALRVIFLFLIVSCAKAEIAIFAGGCFWCLEEPFDKLEGVNSTTSGYIGGSKANATYQKVSSGKTQHVEVVRIDFDSKKVSYKKLLNVFWRQINPTDAGGQFVDRGPQYVTGIFYTNEQQKTLATKSREAIQKFFKKKVVTPIIEAKTFYPAEDYHQDYYKKSPIRYKFYRYNSGRDKYLKKSPLAK